MSYTKGPWTVDSYGSTMIWAKTKAGDMKIADIRGWEHLTRALNLPVQEAIEIQNANAYLVAAAPELLAALNGVLALIESGQLVRNTIGDADPDWAMRQIPFVLALKAASSAIAKAEGQ